MKAVLLSCANTMTVDTSNLTCPCSINRKLEGRVCDLHAHSHACSLVLPGAFAQVDSVDVQRARVVHRLFVAVLVRLRVRVLVPVDVVVLSVHLLVDVLDPFGVRVCDSSFCFCEVRTVKKFRLNVSVCDGLFI